MSDNRPATDLRSADAPELVLGPMLRHVDATSATVWVETSGPCTVCVEVGAGVLDVPVTASGATWGVHGHHYAILVVHGLPEGSELPYRVLLGSAGLSSSPSGAADAPQMRCVWPPTEDDDAAAFAAFPPSTLRTARSDGKLRLAFGSCRRSEPLDAAGVAAVGPDALVELAHRTAEAARSEGSFERPDVLLMLGDQLYADEPSEPIKERLERARRDPDVADHPEVAEEICTFEEYTWLYTESWSAPPVRWLLSTMPTCMLLDDHDLRDDWNTSQAWREEMRRKPWFDDRVRGALGSYWVYQHLGNLSPAELDREQLLAAVTAAEDDDARTALLDDYAERADTDPDAARWSYVRDFGRTGTHGGEGGEAGGGVRLVAVDCRCSRRLDPGNRAILDDAEWAWVQEQAQPGAPVDHLLLASTLPVLMVPAFSDIEAWNEALVAGRWGRWLRRPAEALRQAIDLEHWPAFGTSLHDLLRLLAGVAGTTRPPSSILMLSGDVHCSYTARAQLDGVVGSPTAVHQLVMSPFRNPLKPALRVANRLADIAPVRALAGLLARTAGVERPPATWEVEEGPWFDNGVMTVVLDGRSARLEVDHVRVDRDGRWQRRTHHRTLA
ncbi:PhoD-like phosphatase [Quadrisphaera granulorum]|uniref:PhoD-like phosphatase n=1 Tax=Quadrisphaera granulorum TaxID=317664 RepID=A0A316A8I0_9ACTN|nr:alkaline phosphatase D family protein [Quadrisphaera granulorum]PWJ53280.1 PhoD-like phosphatase [Quadrisphaera granulorum]SZE96954.1 PhoD-like phosphatase [Quadrisphaera granulorum]